MTRRRARWPAALAVLAVLSTAAWIDTPAEHPACHKPTHRPATCGPTTTTGVPPSTSAPTTSTSPTTTPTTSPPATSTSSSVPQTVPTTSGTTSTSPSISTTSTPGTSTSTSTTSSTTSTSTSSSTTTTTVGGTQTFTATFATSGDFTGRFRTYVGNACNAAQTCEPCSAGVGICEFPGDHDLACGAPTTIRTVHVRNHAELFWWCAPNGPDTGHVMIGMNTSGYAISGFAPLQTFNNVTSICWDQNLTDLGGGKWMVLTVVPAAVFNANLPRLDYTLPEFDQDNAPGDFNLQRQSRWQFKLFRNQLRIFDSISGSSGADWGVDGGLIAGADRATRYRHCLTETATGMIVSQAGASWSAPGVRFPDGPVGVIWADDTYDADKHGGTHLYTWHFDNIEIRSG